MFRVKKQLWEQLRGLGCTRPPEPLRFFTTYEVGRKTVLHSDRVVILYEPEVSLVVGYEHFLADTMPMHPERYQGLDVENGRRLKELARSFYFETDPLLSSIPETEDCTFWGYLAQLVNITVQRWKCTHPVAFAALKEIEMLARRENIPKDAVYFCESNNIDVLLRVDQMRVDDELTRTFRLNVWGTTHEEYVRWFTDLPQLFEVLDVEGPEPGLGVVG